LLKQIAQSVEDNRRQASPRQCIEIDDPVWRAGHPDLTAEELDAYFAMVDALEKRVASGEIPSWEDYERSHYGYPTYEHQSYGFAEAIAFIRESADHIEGLCAEKGIVLESSGTKQKAA
jgi:hypothetical protein